MSAVTECEHLVQYYETDQMGVAHHSNYIRWYEEASTRLLEDIGLRYAGVETEGVTSPVVAGTARYKSPAHYCDTVVIRAEITKYTGVRFDVTYKVYDKATQEVRCTGTSEHCFISRDGRILSLKRAMPEVHERLERIISNS